MKGVGFGRFSEHCNVYVFLGLWKCHSVNPLFLFLPVLNSDNVLLPWYCVSGLKVGIRRTQTTTYVVFSCTKDLNTMQGNVKLINILTHVHEFRYSYLFYNAIYIYFVTRT
jgi:hypothetical protein